MAYLLTNIYTKNYWNRRLLLKLTLMVGCCTFLRHSVHCVSKNAPLRQIGINSVIFQIQKKIQNILFVGNFILNKSCT